MLKRLDDIKLSVERPESELINIITKRAGAKPSWFKILKKSLDARDKSHIFWQYSIAYSTKPYMEPKKQIEKVNCDKKIAVIGGGPCGLFCAVRLIEHGLKPVIFERGEAVEQRRATCQKFFDSRVLDSNSNVQFGEGGAGAFSDGKLNTRTKDGLNADVLEIFARFGAPEEVLYLNKPHVGSDRLYSVLQNIRKFIIENGGEYRFNEQFIGFTVKYDAVDKLHFRNVKTGKESEYKADFTVLAVGHSARDTFEMLNARGVYMEPKEFSAGVRIEHLSENISRAQYGEKFRYLPAADYRLVSHADERAVFTFCMCPGGIVMPAASEQGGVAINGMSNYARDGVNSNSALMVQLKRGDFGADDLFAGMRFQQKIERAAYEYGSGFRAPVQLYKDFSVDRISQNFGEVKPTYAAGVTFAPLDEVLPQVITKALKAAIPDMGRRLKGFDCGDAVLTAPETRFSSPVKIVRGDDGQSVSIAGLFPCGEGSGYSGGITSSAADGLQTAEKIFKICVNNH